MTLAVLLAAPPARGAFQPALRVARPLRALAPRACADAFGPMTYRELQAACKAAGLPARGKADELRARLREQGSDGASESVPEPSLGLADAWVMRTCSISTPSCMSRIAQQRADHPSSMMRGASPGPRRGRSQTGEEYARS